jgi:hypothetical protein
MTGFDPRFAGFADAILGVTAHSQADTDRVWMGRRAAFPDAGFEGHHAIGRDDPEMPPRAAVRWSLHGRHAGCGALGRPSGAEVHVLGVAHAEFGRWLLRREPALRDETAVWKQIVLPSG